MQCICPLIVMKRKIAFIIILLVVAALVGSFVVSSRRQASNFPPDVRELTARVNHLEELVAKLEKKAAAAETSSRRSAVFTPDGKTITTQEGKTVRVWEMPNTPKELKPTPTQPGPIPNTPSTKVPPAWKPREFNGSTYYVIPLAR